MQKIPDMPAEDGGLGKERGQLDRIEAMLVVIIDRLGGEADCEHKEELGLGLGLMRDWTLKQHATAQMVLAGLSNRDIAEVLGVTENTAKVHVRTLARKLGVHTRAQIVAEALPILEAADSNSYELLTGGLPKDWAIKLRGKPHDPHLARIRDTHGG